MSAVPHPLPVLGAGDEPASARRVWWRSGALAVFAWAALAALALAWPNKVAGFTDWAYTREFGIAAAVVSLALLVVVLLEQRSGRIGTALRPAGPWLVALPVLLGLWQLFTAKLAWLPTPFFAPPQSLAEVWIDDWKRLGESTWHSLRLLAHGVAIGALAGFLTGVAIGWSRAVG